MISLLGGGAAVTSATKRPRVEVRSIVEEKLEAGIYWIYPYVAIDDTAVKFITMVGVDKPDFSVVFLLAGVMQPPG